MSAGTATTGRDTGAPATTLRLPQVNLLPPEVSAERGLRKVKRWALLSLLLVVLVVGLAYVMSAFQLAAARNDLTVAQADTVRLQGRLHELAEVPRVMGALDTARSARELVTSTEVLWKPYLDQVRAALPADAAIQTLQTQGATPVVSAVPPGDPLQTQSLGQISFTATTVTVPDAAALADALAAIPGLTDPRIQSMVLQSDEDNPGYLLTGTVQYGESALAGRYAPTAEED
ncbi:fimbrial assembly protein [Cellulomonas shaoxiangyii]|uniref:Fimbrial assembly protein n=1 Tax=Cellulomonas shaoxiangyii TaxID=2566013 RepID=A0A4P7SIP5_9CELL|nr:fimbrial assembly protein [Cellulomonas shaoxiangyii]QCB93641.1 fimbrial assembly protein [Cellulomonas shaoxiangyii]TGY84628.1 fimbrial assembly protein [Cellulomonas shaoxiangyii]